MLLLWLLLLLLWFNASLLRSNFKVQKKMDFPRLGSFKKCLCDFYKLCIPNPYQSMIQMELYSHAHLHFLQSSGFAETPPSVRGKVHICLHGSYWHSQTVHFGVSTTQLIFNTFHFFFILGQTYIFCYLKFKVLLCAYSLKVTFYFNPK